MTQQAGCAMTALRKPVYFPRVSMGHLALSLMLESPSFSVAVGMKPRCLKANNPFIHDSLWSVQLNPFGY